MLRVGGEILTFTGCGNGPVDAFVHALRDGANLPVHVLDYHEHAVGSGEGALAAAYVQLRVGEERATYGVGLDRNIVTATLRAVVSAANRACAQGWIAPAESPDAVPAPALAD